MAKKSEEIKDIHAKDIKTVELSKDATPRKYQEFYEEWVKTCQNTYGNFYEIHTVESSKEAFENFFESIPTVSPFKEIFEPVKNAAKIYADTFTSISCNWMKSYPISARIKQIGVRI